MEAQTPQDDIDTFYQYLKGTLPEEEHKAFEEKIATDPDFKEEAELNEDLLFAMNVHHKKQLKEKFRTWSQEIKPARVRPIRRYRTLAVAAVLLLLVTASYFWLFRQDTHQQLFTDYYKAYYNIYDVQERDFDDSKPIHKALKRYEEQQYTTAIPLFEQELKQRPNDMGLLFYSGLSYLSVNQADIASEKLQRVASSGDKKYSEAAQWYLALSFLKAGKPSEAKGFIYSNTQLRQQLRKKSC